MKDGKSEVLCIDDDQDVLDGLRMIIESSGYIMHEATSAAEGLQRYDEIGPDFVLMMESVDAGVDLARRLKSRGDSVPLYMLSTVGNDMLEQTLPGDVGLDGVLQKPIEPQRLLSLLQRRLSTSG